LTVRAIEDLDREVGQHATVDERRLFAGQLVAGAFAA
jgi:hypothetical protein